MHARTYTHPCSHLCDSRICRVKRALCKTGGWGRSSMESSSARLWASPPEPQTKQSKRNHKGSTEGAKVGCTQVGEGSDLGRKSCHALCSTKALCPGEGQRQFHLPTENASGATGAHSPGPPDCRRPDGSLLCMFTQAASEPRTEPIAPTI